MKYLVCLSMFFIVLFSCSNNQLQNDPIPNHETFTIASKFLSENRVINVWFPENYKNSSDSLPVLYMLDGGIKEDFPHVANTLAELIKSNKIKPIILVGIENTQRRRDLTPPTTVAKDKEIAPVVGGSSIFRQFIQEELIPEINTKFRDNSNLRTPAASGDSFGEPWHIGYYRVLTANSFSNFNGENPNGNWTLTITENSASDGARFNKVDLIF